MTFSATPQARVQHRREHVRLLRWHATDRGQHRRTHRHPRHPCPLRKARRAGESALPTRPARTARLCCVTRRRARRRRRNQEDHTKRPRSRREALGPLSGIGGKSPRAALPNTHQPAQTLCNDAPNQAKPSKTNGCAASGYRADCPKRVFEFPILGQVAPGSFRDTWPTCVCNARSAIHSNPLAPSVSPTIFTTRKAVCEEPPNSAVATNALPARSAAMDCWTNWIVVGPDSVGG